MERWWRGKVKRWWRGEVGRSGARRGEESGWNTEVSEGGGGEKAKTKIFIKIDLNF